LSRANPAAAVFLIHAGSLVSTLLQPWGPFASCDWAIRLA
jgi:hypothetical protein